MQLDVVIFGGGAAGLWLLDEVTRRGRSALLLEAGRMGSGQTVASQGIIHGGLKYTLQGLLTPSAANIRDMPRIWRDCLAGRREPILQRTPIRSECCYLWRTQTVTSRLGMLGARMGLQVQPHQLRPQDRPPVLAGCPGAVARLDEQVISPAGLIADLAARNHERILQINAAGGLEFECDDAGHVGAIRLRPGDAGELLTLRPQQVVFTAGAGNSALRQQVGLSVTVMQRRPLHMVLARGRLPTLNGHCVDGAKTRVTITTDVDTQGRTVWQLGGRIAEEGVGRDAPALIRHTAEELRAVIPGVDLTGVEWTTYRVDRAEAAEAGGKRPESFRILHDGNVLTAWPTKLVLVPLLAERIADSLDQSAATKPIDVSVLADWPRPRVALPPWETKSEWQVLPTDETSRKRAA